jgi:hypothetical protein
MKALRICLIGGGTHEQAESTHGGPCTRRAAVVIVEERSSHDEVWGLYMCPLAEGGIMIVELHVERLIVIRERDTFFDIRFPIDPVCDGTNDLVKIISCGSCHELVQKGESKSNQVHSARVKGMSEVEFDTRAKFDIVLEEVIEG